MWVACLAIHNKKGNGIAWSSFGKRIQGNTEVNHFLLLYLNFNGFWTFLVLPLIVVDPLLTLSICFKFN